MVSKEDLVKELEMEVLTCQRCRLCQTAKQAVPGAGSAQAKIMFVGEAPGYYEDQQGIPFVGQAGKLLDKLLADISIKRAEVYITNVVKHRPPENRDPFPDEIKFCKPFLDRQLEIINPQVIVALGRFGLQYFFPDSKISADHGVPRFWGVRLVYPVYHPAAALRNPAVGRVLREDFLKLPEIISKKEELLYQPLITEDDSNPQMRLFK